MSEPTTVPIIDLSIVNPEEVLLHFTDVLSAPGPHNDTAQTTNPAIYSHRYTPEQLRRRFAAINHIFTDADGTILPEGLQTIPEEYLHLLHKLKAVDIRVTIVTGKPLTEVEPIFRAAGKDAPFDVMCEKGAYIASVSKGGEVQIKHLLSTPRLEKEVLE